MPDNFEISAALRETGQLLKIKGENAFKAKAYLTAARSVAGTVSDIGELIEQDRLKELPGVGESLAWYITELYNTGETKLLNALHSEFPPGTAELSLVEGLSLKKIKLLHENLGITSVADLQKACEEGAVANVKGFSTKSQNDILQALKNAADEVHQIRLVNALEISDLLVNFLRGALKTEKVEAAGALRRWHEAVDDIIIVAESSHAKIQKALEKYHKYVSMEVREKSFVCLLPEGINLFVYAVENLTLGLIEHTGSSQHFADLQKVVTEAGLALIDTQLKRGSALIEPKSELELFSMLNLNFIPPELREGTGEVEQARTDDFSNLIELGDIRGMTHCHSTYSDGNNTIEQMAKAAQKLGMDYITITDHSPTAHYAGGVEIDRLKEQWEEIDRVQEKLKIKIFKGTELDILADGKLDYPDHILDQFDFIVASIHSRYKQNEEQMTKRLLGGLRNPHYKIWGHPLGRLVLHRYPIPCDVEKILEAIADARVAIEINGDPHRLDLAPQWARIAKSLGLKFVISTDAHAISDMQNLDFGIAMGRRAGLEKSDVLNTLSSTEFEKIVKAA